MADNYPEFYADFRTESIFQKSAPAKSKTLRFVFLFFFGFLEKQFKILSFFGYYFLTVPQT
jgi:hypothetical protein